MKGVGPGTAGIALLLATAGMISAMGWTQTREALDVLGPALLEARYGELVQISTYPAYGGQAPGDSETAPESPVPATSGVPVPVETVPLPPLPEASSPEPEMEQSPAELEETDPTEVEWEEEEPESAAVAASAPIPAGALELTNDTGYAVSFPELPGLPQGLDLSGDPAILIVHTHTTEGYAESPGYRTQDPDQGVMAVGDALAEELEARGFQVLHDKTVCDEPDFDDAYNRSRELIQADLHAYPSICLVLDVHRDAVEDADGEQMALTADLEAGEAARLMLVVGTDDGGLEHPLWRQNLSLAAILQSRMEGAYPGLMRPINLRPQRFNQDLGPMNLLLEVGTSGCETAEATLGARLFARSLADVLEQINGKNE